MPDKKEPPKPLRNRFRIVGGTDTPDAIAALKLKLSVDEYLELENTGFDFNPTEHRYVEEVDVSIDGKPVTVFIDMSPPKDSRLDKSALKHPDSDMFDFKP